VSMQKTF